MKRIFTAFLLFATLCACLCFCSCDRAEGSEEIELRSLCLGVGAPLPKASDFVVSMPKDYEIRFDKEYHFDSTGEYRLGLVLTDPRGKESFYEASFSLIIDSEPPSLVGAKDLSVYIGDGISYKNDIELFDNCDGALHLEIDSSAVDLDHEGIYPVSYIAKDAAGNQTTVSISVYVYRERVTQEDLFELIDPIIADRVPTASSLEQQVRSVYVYVYNHIDYDAYSDKSDWVRAAYDGMRTGKGDCFTYFALSKAFFTRLGIDTMDIQRKTGLVDERHYWNLVNIGTERSPRWYHFDACRLSGVQHNGCLLTDLQVKAYTKQRVDEDGNGNYFYVYDTSGYPISDDRIITETPSLEPYY